MEGPIDHDSSYTLLIRGAYLILIPLLIWIILNWLWTKYKLTYKANEIMNRILSGLISLTLLIFSYFKYKSDTYIKNTEYARTSDGGMEAVGNYIEVNGTDWAGIMILLIGAFLFFYLGVLKRKNE